MNVKAYWIFDADVINRNVVDWLSAHISFMPPLHRYEGHITYTGDALIFQGIDKFTSEEIEFTVLKEEFDQLYLGFDDVFSALEAKGLGMWKPLRIKFYQLQKLRTVYVIINYRMGITENSRWFETLKNWLS